MVACKNSNFTAFDFEQHTLEYTSLVGEIMIFIKQQLPQTFWNRGVIGLAIMDNTLITWKKENFVLKQSTNHSN